MLTISEFSEMCRLSPQTLRYYHAEGLLVPSGVDERTGYRSYTFDQIEQAMLVTVLRGTGMSVKQVRRALDEPDVAAVLLEEHHAELQRLRRAQDEAIRDARELVSARPEPRVRRAPAATVVSAVVPGSATGSDEYDWGEADAALDATVREVGAAVRACGAAVTGTPWRTWAMETPEQRRGGLTAEGPHWLVKVPVTEDADALAALPGHLEVQRFEARDELAILIPGRSSMAKFGTALSRLLTHPLENAFPDLATLRLLLHDDGVETAIGIAALDEAGLRA